MESNSIPLHVSTEAFGNSTFHVGQSLGTPIEQSQPAPANGPTSQTDSVTISSKALELSSQPQGKDSK